MRLNAPPSLKAHSATNKVLLELAERDENEKLINFVLTQNKGAKVGNHSVPRCKTFKQDRLSIIGTSAKREPLKVQLSPFSILTSMERV